MATARRRVRCWQGCWDGLKLPSLPRYARVRGAILFTIGEIDTRSLQASCQQARVPPQCLLLRGMARQTQTAQVIYRGIAKDALIYQCRVSAHGAYQTAPTAPSCSLLLFCIFVLFSCVRARSKISIDFLYRLRVQKYVFLTDDDHKLLLAYFRAWGISRAGQIAPSTRGSNVSTAVFTVPCYDGPRPNKQIRREVL